MANGALCPAEISRSAVSCAVSATVTVRGGMAAATLASAGTRSNDADQARRRSLRGLSSTFACVGIDPDMGGAIALVTFDRDDAVLHEQPGDGRDSLVSLIRAPLLANGRCPVKHNGNRMVYSGRMVSVWHVKRDSSSVGHANVQVSARFGEAETACVWIGGA